MRNNLPEVTYFRNFPVPHLSNLPPMVKAIAITLWVAILLLRLPKKADLGNQCNRAEYRIQFRAVSTNITLANYLLMAMD